MTKTSYPSVLLRANKKLEFIKSIPTAKNILLLLTDAESSLFLSFPNDSIGNPR